MVPVHLIFHRGQFLEINRESSNFTLKTYTSERAHEHAGKRPHFYHELLLKDTDHINPLLYFTILTDYAIDAESLWKIFVSAGREVGFHYFVEQLINAKLWSPQGNVVVVACMPHLITIYALSPDGEGRLERFTWDDELSLAIGKNRYAIETLLKLDQRVGGELSMEDIVNSVQDMAFIDASSRNRHTSVCERTFKFVPPHDLKKFSTWEHKEMYHSNIATSSSGWVGGKFESNFNRLLEKFANMHQPQQLPLAVEASTPTNVIPFSP